MHILQVHNFYQQPGGEDIVLANEEKLLTRKGHQVVQYVLHNDAIPEMSKIHVAIDTFWNNNAYRAIRSKIHKHGIDVIHVHNTFPLVSPAIYYAADAEGVPVVQTLHNYRLICPAATFFRDGENCEECLGKFFAWPGVRHRCYRHSAAASGTAALMIAAHKMFGTYRSKVAVYIALSQFSMKKFVDGDIPRERIRVKPNFVLEDPTIGSGYGGYALFVGRLAPEKGIDTLLKAWSALKIPIKLKIAGDGPLRPLVASAAETNPRVEYLGQCPRDRVNELMRNAALLVFPSEWYEGSPLSVMEAMACGTPVLATNIGSLSEMIVPGKNGFLFPPEIPGEHLASLIASLERLFANKDTLDGMRYSTRQYYETHFAAGPNYEALMAIYNSVVPTEATR